MLYGWPTKLYIFLYHYNFNEKEAPIQASALRLRASRTGKSTGITVNSEKVTVPDQGDAGSGQDACEEGRATSRSGLQWEGLRRNASRDPPRSNI